MAAVFPKRIFPYPKPVQNKTSMHSSCCAMYSHSVLIFQKKYSFSCTFYYRKFYSNSENFCGYSYQQKSCNWEEKRNLKFHLKLFSLFSFYKFIEGFYQSVHSSLLAAVANDSSVLMLLILIAIDAMPVPLHHKLEKWITKVMVEKNKKIRLDARRKQLQSWKEIKFNGKRKASGI